VQLAYVDQSRTLNPANPAWQEISRGQEMGIVGKKELNSRAHLSSSNFRGTDQQKKVGDLSGGERGRLYLTKTLREGRNVLMLDEPTNDLDVDTLRTLEEALLDLAGCAVVISHEGWSSIASRRTSLRSREIPRWCASREISRRTKKT
jgi:energy-dependent translational throttle protein EttA